ncbi:MAG: hypothetical protein LBE17_03865 [Treponema sp.]|jgi:hypothetical protein|nr:hypothetical protein [Treponema sp.]
MRQVNNSSPFAAFSANDTLMEKPFVSPADKEILRELGKRYAEIAADEVNEERIRRIKDMHSLKQVRPPLWFGQIPWHEFDGAGELTPRCRGEWAREMETFFRQQLFQWKYFQGDMIAEDAYYVYKTFSQTGIGIDIVEETLATDSKNNIVSHHYEDQLDSEEKLDALKPPEVTAYPEKDAANLETASEILDGILPVKLRGHGIYYQPWDIIVRFRGIQNCLLDMVDNPSLIHSTIKKFNAIYESRYTQMESLGLLDYSFPNMNCTPTNTGELPASDYDEGRVRLKDVWWCGTAQIFVSASPAMNEEFNLQYLRPFMEKCGLSYYGCCEPLHQLVPYLRKIPNMRKIGASPWTNLRVQAEQTGGDYVLSRKPNPAFVAVDINADVVEKEITETIEVCRVNNTPFEYVLKDISTVNYRVENLVEWTRIVSGVIDRYY